MDSYYFYFTKQFTNQIPDGYKSWSASLLNSCTKYQAQDTLQVCGQFGRTLIYKGITIEPI